MKKVLIITYYWPPGSGSGVQRFLKFTKYLNSFGWQPVILTVKNGNFTSIDHTLLEDIPNNTPVYRSYSLEPFYWYNLLLKRKSNSSTAGSIGIGDKSVIQKIALYIRANFFIPDARIGWNRLAYRVAKKIFKQHKIDAIITTGPPQSTHLIGERIKNNFNLPWIVDLRDPWTTVFYNSLFPRTENSKLKDKRMEDRIVKSADAITVVSEGLVSEFQSRNENISLIYNGYDESDFNITKRKSIDKFKITYVGNLMSNQNIESFWAALSNLINKNKIFKEKIVLELVGNIDPSVYLSIKQFGLKSYIKKVGFVDHHQSVKHMINSDLLLFVIPNSEDNFKIITGKLFEYLATGNDILSIGPIEGDASKILKKLNHFSMIDYTNVSEIENTILDSFNLKKREYKMNHISKYSRYKQTEKLADLLNKITS
ncbi:MAG: hypothetical protein ACON4Y_02690 [Flavobacteriales bacterium]